MATLSKVVSITRLILKWAAILVFSIVISLMLIRVGTNLRNRFFPPPLPPPTVAFGKLPDLKFPKSAISGKFSYSIETLTGSLPTFPGQITVYKTAKNQPNLLSLEKAKKKVAQLGFTMGERPLSTTLYQWDVEKRSNLSIKFDIVSNDFDMTSDFYNNAEILAAQNLPEPQKSTEIAKNFLTRINLLPPDVDVEGAKVSFSSIQGNFLTPSTSLANAQIVRVDLFQKPIDNFPIVYPKKDAALIQILIGSNRAENEQIVEAHFFHRQFSLANPSTYPIKTPEQAFEDLKNNQAYIASIDDKARSDIAINNVYLGYYMSPENDDFYYPVFVFDGDNGFLAYVLAITPAFVENTNQ